MQIWAIDRRVAVILMTGYGESQNMEQVKDPGIRYYMDKPFDYWKIKVQVLRVQLKREAGKIPARSHRCNGEMFRTIIATGTYREGGKH